MNAESSTAKAWLRALERTAPIAAQPQRVLSREQLLDSSRLHNDEVYDRSIDVQIGRLRKKIEPRDGQTQLIRTERGAGYGPQATL